jgi:hypothetical protein
MKKLITLTEKDNEVLGKLAKIRNVSEAEVIRGLIRASGKAEGLEVDTEEVVWGLTNFYKNNTVQHVLEVLKHVPGYFTSNVDERGPNECWNWIGPSNPHIDGVVFHPPIVAWALTSGKVEPVEPTCENYACCNPAHLRPSTTPEIGV